MFLNVMLSPVRIDFEQGIFLFSASKKRVGIYAPTEVLIRGTAFRIMFDKSEKLRNFSEIMYYNAHEH